MIITAGTTLDNGFKVDAYQPSLFFVSRHFNTMYPYAMRRNSQPPYERERWETSDGDFFDLDFVKKGSKSVVILLHGLEGSSSSQYILGITNALSPFDIDICAVNHRSCSGQLNRTLGFYHSGFTIDLAFIIDELSKTYENVTAVGYSLGGNMLLKYLGSCDVPASFKTGIALSVPAHLSSSAVRLNHWSNRPYAIQFLKTLNKKAVAKAKQFPDILDYRKFQNITSLYEFDNKVTAPLHGFVDAEDYYAQSSSAPFLQNIRVPALLINAQDDSFLAPPCFPYEVAQANPHFHFYAPKHGGHVGFARFKSDGYWSDKMVVRWLSSLNLISSSK